jgi:hypothetical protein
MALLDGEVITEMRTAACSAVATRTLAKGFKKLAVLGAGVREMHRRWLKGRAWGPTYAPRRPCRCKRRATSRPTRRSRAGRSWPFGTATCHAQR